MVRHRRGREQSNVVAERLFRHVFSCIAEGLGLLAFYRSRDTECVSFSSGMDLELAQVGERLAYMLAAGQC